MYMFLFFFNDTATTEIYTLSLHDALPISPRARVGNPPPRVAETPAGMVNSIGLQNPGVETFLSDLDAFDLGVPLIVSVAGDTVAEFGSLCERLAGDERGAAIELNLSCPNVKVGEGSDRKSTRLNSSHANISYA